MQLITNNTFTPFIIIQTKFEILIKISHVRYESIEAWTFYGEENDADDEKITLGFI